MAYEQQPPHHQDETPRDNKTMVFVLGGLVILALAIAAFYTRNNNDASNIEPAAGFESQQMGSTTAPGTTAQGTATDTVNPDIADTSDTNGNTGVEGTPGTDDSASNTPVTPPTSTY